MLWLLSHAVPKPITVCVNTRVNDLNDWDLIFLKMFTDKEVHHEKILLWFLFSFEDLNPHQHLGLSISEVYPLMCKLVRYWQLTCVMELFLLVCLMNCWLHCFNCVLLVFNRQRCPLTVCKAMSARVKFWWATWPLDSWNSNEWPKDGLKLWKNHYAVYSPFLSVFLWDTQRIIIIHQSKIWRS